MNQIDIPRQVEISDIELLVHDDYCNVPINQAKFSKVVEKQLFVYNCSDNNLERSRLYFRCRNFRKPNFCNAKCFVTLIRNHQESSISPVYEFYNNHSESCVAKECKSTNKINDDKYHQEAEFIAKYFSYLTPSELITYFNYNEKDINKILNKLKTIKKNYPYYSLDKLLELDKHGNKYHLISPSSDKNIVLFAMNLSYEILSRCDSIYMDSTFKCRVKEYSCTFVINAAIKSHHFTVMMILLPNRKKETYIEMFHRIEYDGKKVCGDQFTLLNRPINIISDFEANLINLSDTFKQFSIHACGFHAKYDNYKYLFANGLPKKANIDNITLKEQKSKQQSHKIDNNDILKTKINNNISSLKRYCSKYEKPSFNDEDYCDPINLEINEMNDFENYEEDKIITNKISLIDIEQYKLNIANDENICYLNRVQIIELIDKIFFNEKSFLPPSCNFKTRTLIKMLMNTSYLNYVFINDELFSIIFSEIKSKISTDYLHIIDKHEKYFNKYWINQVGFEKWNVFNSDWITNNISESVNSKLNWGIYDSSSISVPKFIWKVKLTFFNTQKQVDDYNKGNLKPQVADHTYFKRSLIVMLNIELFSKRIDLFSYLYLIIKINKITSKEDRRNVLKEILMRCDSIDSKLLNIYLLSKNYRITNNNYLLERIKFFNWVRTECDNKSYIGIFITKCYIDITNFEIKSILKHPRSLSVFDEIVEVDKLFSFETKSDNSEETFNSRFYNCCDANQIQTFKMFDMIEKFNLNNPKHILKLYNNKDLRKIEEAKEEKNEEITEIIPQKESVIQLRTYTKDKISGFIFNSKDVTYDDRKRTKTVNENDVENDLVKELHQHKQDRIKQLEQELELCKNQINTIKKQNEEIMLNQQTTMKQNEEIIKNQILIMKKFNIWDEEKENN